MNSMQVVKNISWHLVKTYMTTYQMHTSILEALGTALLVIKITIKMEVSIQVIVSILSQSKKWGRQKDMSMPSVTSWQLFAVGLILLPVLLWLYDIKKLPAITVSLHDFLNRVSVCFFGYLVLDQTLTSIQRLGVASILIATLFAILLATTKQNSINH
jgi:drug/metabolite transporter (DMT)-like permease